MSDKNIGQQQAKVISRIHQHLATDFHPVLKHIAAAAINFSRTQEANQKAFSEYVGTLNQLVASAKNAEPDAQQVAEELKVMIKKMNKIGTETSKLIADFKEIAERVNTNAEAEKDNHRKTLNKYLKEQRQAHKDADKKRKSDKDLQAFYSEKYDETNKLQFLRYKYFTEKHSKLLNRFTEVWKEIATVFPNIVLENPEIAENESQKAESKHTDAVSSPRSEKQESRATIPSHLSVKEEVTKPIEVIPVSVPQHNEFISPVSQPDDTIGRFFHDYDREEVGTFPKDKSGRSSPYSGSRHNPLENYSSKPNLQQIYVPVLPQSARVESTQPPQPHQPAEPIHPMPPVKPIEPPSREEPVQPLPRPRQKAPETYAEDSLLIPVKNTYAPVYNERYSGLNHINQSPAAPASQHPITVPPVAPPPAPPRKEKPVFTASDYGCVLICTVPYTAKTEKQITLNSGEAAQLIRSGERGWLLLRAFSEQSRIGWFPAKFVRRGTETEQRQYLP